MRLLTPQAAAALRRLAPKSYSRAKVIPAAAAH